jgi:hypothetical protein
MPLLHDFTSVIPDTASATKIQPSHWNDAHVLSLKGIAYAPTDDSDVASVSAGQNYQTYLRRKFNAAVAEAYEFSALPTYHASDYNFTPQTFSTVLTAGVDATITLSPVPLGVNAGITTHYFYISDGANSELVVLKAGGTATSGAASGTIIFTPANNHSDGAWSIISATAGVQEAVHVAGAAGGGQVIIGAGDSIFYGPCRIKYNKIYVKGVGSASMCVSAHATHHVFHFDGPNTTSDETGFASTYINQCKISHLYFQHNTADKTAGSAVYVEKADGFYASELAGYDWPTFIHVKDCNSINFNKCSSYIMRETTGMFAYIDGGSDLFMKQCYASGNMLTPPNSGIAIVKHGGFYLDNCSMFATGTGLVLLPTGGNTVQNGFLVNNAWDSCSNNGISIIPTGSGSTVRAIMSIGDRNGANRHSSILIGPSVSAIVQGITFIGHRGILSHRDGILITDDTTCTLRDISIRSSNLGMNGYPYYKNSEDAVSGLNQIVVDGAGIATVHLYYQHDIQVGNSVVVAGATVDTDLNGTYTVLSRTNTEFTFQTTSVAAGTYTEAWMNVRVLGVHCGIRVACAITNFAITDCLIGPVEEGTTDLHNYEIQLGAYAIANLVIANNILAGGLTGKMLDSSTSKNKVIANNIGISNAVREIAAAATITLGVEDNIRITGNAAAIATINGGYYGRRIYVTFFDAAPAGITTGGNIGRAITAVQSQLMVGVYQENSIWYFN